MFRKLTVRDQALAMRGGNWQECARADGCAPERNNDAVRALTRQGTAQPSAQISVHCWVQCICHSGHRDSCDKTDKTAWVARIGWVLFQDLEEVQDSGG